MDPRILKANEEEKAALRARIVDVQKNWKNALQAADNRYHALRQAAVYAEAMGADPEMIKGWKRTLWSNPESGWPNLTPEAERMREKLKSQ